MRVIVGGLIVCAVLFVLPGERSLNAYLLSGVLAAWLVALAGPRSAVERVGLALLVGGIAWAAGPRAPRGESLLEHLLGWTAAGSALAYYLRPRAE